MLNIQTGIRNAVGRGHSRSTVTAPKSPLVIDGNVKNSPASAASTPKYLYYYFIIIIFNINKINNIKINIFMFYYQSLLLFKVFTFSFSPCFFLFSHCMVLCWHIQDLPLSFLVPAILITSKSFTLLQKFWIFHSMFHSYPRKIQQFICIHNNYREGSSNTIPHNTGPFKFKDYCPHAFRFLRHRFGIDTADYMVHI